MVKSRQVGCHDLRPNQRVWLSCCEPFQRRPEQVQLHPREFSVLSALLSFCLALWMGTRGGDLLGRLLCALSLGSSCGGCLFFCLALRSGSCPADPAAREAYEKALDHAAVPRKASKPMGGTRWLRGPF